MENNFEQPLSRRELQLTEVIKSNLVEAAKWAKFIAIIGFIGTGFMVIVGLFFGTIMGMVNRLEGTETAALPSFVGAVVAVVYILLALLYFFPLKYLYDFSSKVKRAIEITDQNLFSEAILKLKSHYKYIGILMIVMICLYILGIIISIIAGVAAAALS